MNMITDKKLKRDFFPIAQKQFEELAPKIKSERFRLAVIFSREARESGFDFIKETLPICNQGFQLSHAGDATEMLNVISNYA